MSRLFMPLFVDLVKLRSFVGSNDAAILAKARASPAYRRLLDAGLDRALQDIVDGHVPLGMADLPGMRAPYVYATEVLCRLCAGDGPNTIVGTPALLDEAFAAAGIPPSIRMLPVMTGHPPIPIPIPLEPPWVGYLGYETAVQWAHTLKKRLRQLVGSPPWATARCPQGLLEEQWLVLKGGSVAFDHFYQLSGAADRQGLIDEGEDAPAAEDQYALAFFFY